MYLDFILFIYFFIFYSTYVCICLYKKQIYKQISDKIFDFFFFSSSTKCYTYNLKKYKFYVAKQKI